MQSHDAAHPQRVCEDELQQQQQQQQWQHWLPH